MRSRPWQQSWLDLCIECSAVECSSSIKGPGSTKHGIDQFPQTQSGQPRVPGHGVDSDIFQRSQVDCVTAGAAEDQRRNAYISTGALPMASIPLEQRRTSGGLRTFFTSVRERRGSALASQRTGLTSVETGGRWSSGGRCCQRFSRFRRAATRYYAAGPARTDLHRSTHRDVAREDQRRNAYILPLARPSKGKAWSAMITWTQPATGAACAGLLRSAPQYGQYLSLGLTPRWHCGHAGLNW